ncbi:MAG TPA: hypothetical protein ENJ52_03655 [Aliiroseovarius sp.]|nr:hypothetical protein [Aliiroseovarius sp.]
MRAILILLAMLGTAPLTAQAGDPRAWQHGLNILEIGPNRFLAIWSSDGIPPKAAPDGAEWRHDVYYSWLDGADPHLAPRVLIAAPLAQEPASSAIAANGNILVTMEDAFDAPQVLKQSFAVFDRRLRPLRPYPQVAMQGGHSGHAAAAGKRFAVAFSEGWVDGGGVNNLGTGDDVWLSVLGANGRVQARQPVAVGPATCDGWPLVAGSPGRFLVLWQRFVPGSRGARLLFRLFDAARGGPVGAERQILRDVAYYTYDVQYLPGPDAFLVLGRSRAAGGVAMLISPAGRILAQKSGLPPIVREAQPATRRLGAGTAQVVYPTGRRGLAVLRVSRDAIAHQASLKARQSWGTTGTDGVFTADGGLFFATLTRRGIRGSRVAPGALRP